MEPTIHGTGRVRREAPWYKRPTTVNVGVGGDGFDVYLELQEVLT